MHIVVTIIHDRFPPYYSTGSSTRRIAQRNNNSTTRPIDKETVIVNDREVRNTTHPSSS